MAPSTLMALTRIQVGMIGEALFTIHAIHDSSGQLECYRASADDDHRDYVVGRKGDPRTAFVQVKTDATLDRSGRVQASVRFHPDNVFEHPGFLYAVLFVPDVAVEACWLVPSPDFNRLAYRDRVGTYVQLLMQPYVDRDDRYSQFRINPRLLGPHLLETLDRLAAAGLLPMPTPPSLPIC